MYRRTLLALTAIVLSVTSLQILFVQQASADPTVPTPYLAQPVLDAAKKSTERNTLGMCVGFNQGYAFKNSGGGYDIKPSDIASGAWFSNATSVRQWSDYNNGDNGTDCDHINPASALQDLGFTSGNIQAACALGVTRQNNSDCVNGSGDMQYSGSGKQDVLNRIDKTYPGTSFGKDYSAEQYYVMAMSIVLSSSACNATPLALAASATPDQKNTANTDTFAVVASDGTTTNVLYQFKGNTGTSWSFRNAIGGDTYYVNETCDQLKTVANQNAPAYAAWVKANQPGTASNPGTCEQYASLQVGGKTTDPSYNTLLSACNDGLANKTIPDYCNKYKIAPIPHTPISDQTSPEQEACLYGYGTALASAPPSGTTDGTTTSDKTSCVIQGIGWIVCPVTTFLAKVVDAAYKFVASLLTVQPLYVTGGTSTGNASADAASKGVFDAWSIMRNFANVVFVIVFLVIIFSQVTSIGITNYGIKRMLPRLIIAAVLVNISYWICAAAVDISNILGTSITALFEYLKSSITLPTVGSTSSGVGGWEGIAGPILAGVGIAAAALYIGLAALLPMLLAALLAILTVFLVLTLRQALIILLIVISPLAFVAYLLPNTETWYKKWRELFQTLLLMFPIISGIFGASALASIIVMATAKDPYKIAIQIMGAGISVIPLAITPIVMKSAGGLLNRFGGMVNNPNKGPFDRARKAAEGYRNNRQEYRQLKALNGYRTLPGRGVQARMANRREAVLNNRKSELSRSKNAEIADLAAGDPGFRKKLAQGGMPGGDERALAHAISIQAKLKADEVTAATAIIKDANIDGDIEALQNLALRGKHEWKDENGKVIKTLEAPAGSALQTAAIQRQFKIGDVEKTDGLVMNSAGMGVDQRQAIAEGMAGMSSKVAYYGGSSGAKVAAGDVGSEAALNQMVADTMDKGKVSKDTFANGDKDSLERMSKVLAGFTSKDSKGNYVSTNVSDATKATVKQLAQDTLEDKRLTPKEQNVKRLTQMAGGYAFTGVPGDDKNDEVFKEMHAPGTP